MPPKPMRPQPICPQCETSIDTHEAAPCLVVWINTLLRLDASSAYSYPLLLSHAWILEETLRAQGIWITLRYGKGIDQSQPQTPLYLVKFWDTCLRRESRAWAASIPLAICRAAVKAMVTRMDAEGRGA